MRIIFGELKKIWNIKILAIIVFLCTAYFTLSMYDWIRWYPSDNWFGNVEFAHHLTENYGTSLSLEDFEDFLNYRDTILLELDPFFQSNHFFIEQGITGFDDLLAFRQYYGARYETLTNEERNLFYTASLELGYIVRTEQYGDLVSENQTPDAYNKMTSFNNVVGLYSTNIVGEDWPSHIDTILAWQEVSQREYTRLTQIRDSGELASIITHHTLFHTWRYTRSLAALNTLATLILVSTLITADRANRVNWLQYSSKQGRRIFTKQFIAVLASAVGITTITALTFAGLFAMLTGVGAFWNNGINSFMGGSLHWLSVTYGQYVILMVGIMYVLSVGAAALAFVMSRFSNNMIRLIFKIIPLLVAAVVLSNWVLGDFLTIFAGGNAHLQLGLVVAVLAVALVIGVVIVQREKLVELK